MKKKIFRGLRIKSAMTFALLIAGFLATGNWSPVTAQIAIGGNGTVTEGAVLDLSQQGAATGGLYLPQVTTNPTEGDLLKDGMLIYNTTDHKIYTYNVATTSWKSVGALTAGANISITDDVISVPVATTTTAGVMSAADKEKLNSLAEGAGLIGIISENNYVLSKTGKIYRTAKYAIAETDSTIDISDLTWTIQNLQEGNSTTDYYSMNAPGVSYGLGGFYRSAWSGWYHYNSLGGYWSSDYHPMRNGYSDVWLVGTDTNIMLEAGPWYTGQAFASMCASVRCVKAD